MTNKTPYLYLDYAAATPLLGAAYEAMVPWLTTEYGNPSAIHQSGQRSRTAIEVARGTIARVLAVRAEHVLFTSGGTESNNLAIKGYLRGLHQAGRPYEAMEIISTMIEHPSVSETLSEVATWGVNIVMVPVDETGVIILPALTERLTKDTVLCVLAYVNSEIGTIQPARAIRRLLDAHYTGTPRPLLMLDGAQAPLWLTCQLTTLGADILTLDAGKCNGPKGMGMVIVRPPAELLSIMGGGGQEGGVRPGTENVAGIVGAAVALEWAQAEFESRATAVAVVRDAGIALLRARLPHLMVNGAEGEARVANNINVSLPGVDTEYAVVVLDAAGIAASTKSACAGAGSGVSGVVLTTTSDPTRARSTLRLTLGPDTTLHDIERVATVLEKHLAMMSAYPL